jgi:hypothetical protein
VFLKEHRAKIDPNPRHPSAAAAKSGRKILKRQLRADGGRRHIRTRPSLRGDRHGPSSENNSTASTTATRVKSPRFFDVFYERFLASSEGGAKFDGVDLQREGDGP